jgi:hypothetical protein
MNSFGSGSVKIVDLNVRPIYHRVPERVRAHILIAMLAYYVWHIAKPWHLSCLTVFDSRTSERWGLRKTWTRRLARARDFQNVLRTMQQVADRQKMLARHGALMSDPRLLMQVTDLRKLKVLERRVLLHGEDEQTGRPYMFVKVSTRRFTLSITRPRSLRPERRPVAIELVRPAAAAVPERPASAAGGGSR